MELKDVAKVLSCTEDDIIDKSKSIIKTNADLTKEMEALRLQNSELTKVNEALTQKVTAQDSILAEQEVGLAIANSLIKEDQKTFALNLLKADKGLYDQFIKNNSAHQQKAPEDKLTLPKNDGTTVKFSDLLKDPAKFMEFAQKYPETFERLRENYHNGGE